MRTYNGQMTWGTFESQYIHLNGTRWHRHRAGGRWSKWMPSQGFRAMSNQAQPYWFVA